MIDDGDEHAAFIYDAMAMNIARNIAKEAPVVKGKIDQIILTGGMAYGKSLCDYIEDHVSFIAPVTVEKMKCSLWHLVACVYFVAKKLQKHL